jgi:hypothetical protein
MTLKFRLLHACARQDDWRLAPLFVAGGHLAAALMRVQPGEGGLTKKILQSGGKIPQVLILLLPLGWLWMQ